MTNLDKLKLKLKITDNSRDDLLEMLLEDAEDAIKGLTNRDKLLDEMQRLVVKYAMIEYERYNNEVTNNVSSMSQGDVSISYTNDIPSDLYKEIISYRKLKIAQIVSRRL